MPDYQYDLFTIGGGSAGVRASRMSARLGARVAVAESTYLGGTCVNVGCIPKKLFAYAAHVHEDVEDAAGFGWRIAAPAFDWPTLRANKDTEIARLNQVYESLLLDAGVEILRGRATLLDAHTVSINGRQITAKHILIATGGWPVKPDIPGAEYAITSNEFFHLETLPKRVLVYGGGYIAVELASIFNGLGAATSLVYRGERLLKNFDADLGTILEIEMVKKGVNLHLRSSMERIDRHGDVCRVQLGGGERLEVDCVLFATGRAPHTAGLGLEAAGVVLNESGAIKVDAKFRSNVPSINAIGDCTDTLALTPVALAEGMVVADRLFNDGRRSIGYENIPTTIFSHPNVGTVGLSEEAARQRYEDVKIFKSNFRALKHTLSGRQERTFMKLVVDVASDRVLGVHMVGADAGEIIQGFAVALNCGATKAQFDATIGIHPTAAEEFVTMREPV
ncbi:MAG TPA: glutathione-disulfide reductase [Usitatibacteraceae bacterium]